MKHDILGILTTMQASGLWAQTLSWLRAIYDPRPVMYEEYPLQPGFAVGDLVYVYTARSGVVEHSEKPVLVTRVDKRGSIFGYKRNA